MFGSRSGSPYGAFGLATAPNQSAGAGGPLNANSGVPMPSGGQPNPGQYSVYNKSLDNEQNVVPSTFVLPSSHPDLEGPTNDISEGDFLFVLRDTSCYIGGDADKYADDYKSKYQRLGKDEVAVVTVQKLNELLCNFARIDYQNHSGGDAGGVWIEQKWGEVELGRVIPSDEIARDDEVSEWTDGNEIGKVPPAKKGEDVKDPKDILLPPSFWWSDPTAVAEWAKPFGAALNSMQLNRWGGGGDPGNRSNKNSWRGHNVVVSRRANVKNNFFTCAGTKGNARWHSQSTQLVGVQYNVENVRVQQDVALPVVQVSMLLLDDPSMVKGCPKWLCDDDGLVYKEGATLRGLTKPFAQQCDADNSGCCRAAARESTPVFAKEKLLNDGWTQDHSTGQKITKLGSCITINATRSGQCAVPDEPSFKIFGDRPLGDPSSRVIISIGRCLHSAPRCPTANDCLRACYSKTFYDSLKPIEIELGCH